MEHPIISIRFTPNLVSGDVSPSAPQYGGVQGDHRAVQVSFDVPEDLQGERFRYRIDGLDGAGGYVTSGLLPLDGSGTVGFLLPAAFTQAGGQLLVRLVVSELDEHQEIGTVHSFDGRLYFADAPAPMDDSLLRGSVAAMLADIEALVKEAHTSFEPKWLSGDGAPTVHTEGKVGQLYRASGGALFECVGVSGDTYTWVKLIRQSDTATAASPGVVAVSAQGTGGLTVGNGGLLSVCPATEQDIDDGAAGLYPNRPITAGNLTYALHGVIPTDTVVSLNPMHWEGDAAPYTYTKTVAGMTADKIITVAPNPNMNATKRDVLRRACITCIGQATDTLTFVADGVKPSQEVSLIVREVG
ncbi:MAG: hypothetical protein IKI63_02445 [Clostridia bacterium]|nr:hypothetical protein [Clostridia bacterium]